MKFLIFILLFLPLTLMAKSNCKLLPTKGCVYLSDINVSRVDVVIYHRGHLKGQSDFPPAQRIQSAKNILLKNQFDIKSIADDTGKLFIVLGSSRVAIDNLELQKILDHYQVSLDKLYLAAHSGGYFGLNMTLRHLLKKQSITEIIMLDSYYSTITNGLREIMPIVQGTGVPCHGFHTSHNTARLKKYYQADGIFCDSVGPGGMDHNKSVGPILSSRLK
jgi:hypothetical protein